MTEKEDRLYTVNDKNQLTTLEFTFNRAKIQQRQEEEINFQYVHTQFHFSEITGLDICLRK